MEQLIKELEQRKREVEELATKPLKTFFHGKTKRACFLEGVQAAIDYIKEKKIK